MTKKLTKHGNSLALVIEKPILDLLQIDADTPLDVFADGDILIIKPLRDAERTEKIRAIHEMINKRYGKLFKRLAE